MENLKTLVLVAKILAVVLLLSGCKSKDINLIKIEGRAQGTTWHISYVADKYIDYKPAIDSILLDIDSSLSTYLSVSLISRINKNDSTVVVDRYFRDVFNKAIEVSEKTEGAFDVTVGPLVNAWGFGFTKKAKVDSFHIDSLLDLVGYKMLRLQGNKLIKEKPQIILDFNAIAQGYSVDVLTEFLQGRGIKHGLIELGGEVKAIGQHNNEAWKVGIDKPESDLDAERKLQAIITLQNRALCTSGNYRKFYMEGGKKYSHIIDPATGYPSRQNLLSATVLAEDGMTADAYATAFMVMGFEKSKEFLSRHREMNLEVYFVYDYEGVTKTYVSESLKNSLSEQR